MAHYFFHFQIYKRTFFLQLGYCYVILQIRNSFCGCTYRQNNWCLRSTQKNVYLLLYGIKDSILAIMKHTEFTHSLGIITVVERLNHCCSGCITGDNLNRREWLIHSLLKINLMPCVMLAPVLLSLKSYFLWSFVSVFFNIKIRYFFCICVSTQGSAVYDLFPSSQPMQSICICYIAEHL